MDHQKTTQHPPKQINSDISLEELYWFFLLLLFILFIKHIYTYTLNSCKLVTLTDDQVQNKDTILKHYQQKTDAIHF